MTIVSSAMMKSLISDGKNISQNYGIMKTFIDLLISKKQYVMIIISLFMILLSFSYFGNVAGILAIISCILLFVRFIANTIYNSKIPEDLTIGLVNEEVIQANKICTKNGDNLNGVFGQQGGENKLLNKLKKLSKELSRK
jgi:hypothetical protein